MASGATLSVLPYYIIPNSFLFLVLTVKFRYFSTAHRAFRLVPSQELMLNKCAIFFLKELVQLHRITLQLSYSSSLLF
jgi:hypothetical protein